MLETNLRFLGLSKEEIKIYLLLLKFGTSSVAQIAHQTGIGRVNCYHHIEKLKQKGCIHESQKSKMKQFSAEKPKIFLNQQIERLNIARELIPELNALAMTSGQRPRVQIFEGRSGIRNIFETMTEQRGGEIVTFSNFDRMTEFATDWLRDHFKNRLENGTKTRFIAPWTEKAESFRSTFFPAEFDERLLEIFLISPGEFHFESEISIFNGIIVSMNLHGENPVGVLMENAELYRTQKAIFDLAWLGATSFVAR
jgi:sugar-specific transcriptional regulator TrmB